MAQIAAVLIAGGTIDPAAWERCMKSLEPYVDGIFVNFNGATGSPADLYKPDVDQYLWKRFSWQEDFALARNQSFALVPKDRYDWMLWIDLDDTLEGGEHLQGMIDGLDPDTQGVFLRYDYAVDPQTGQVMAEQWRERLLRTDAAWYWEYVVHEVCHHPPGTQFAKRDDVWIRHHRTRGPDDPETRMRNRRLLMKGRNHNPDVPRYTYYLANEVYAEAAWKIQIASKTPDDTSNDKEIDDLLIAAIKLYEEFMPNAPSPDDAYMAIRQIGECHRLRQNYDEAIVADLRALSIHPSWPDAYMGLAQSYYDLKDWDKCLHWAQAGEKVAAKPETTQVQEPLNLEYYPKLWQGMALERLGRHEEALEAYRTALLVNYTKELDEAVTMLAEHLSLAEIEQRPPSEAEARKITLGDRPEKSIAFLTRPLFEPWHPELAKQGGIGGAETCVMEIAKRFAADGWRAVVFGTPGDHYGVDPETGVEYWSVNEWVNTEPFTVTVASRAPECFDANINTQLQILWMHDVNLATQNEGPFGDRYDNPDVVVALTDWHRNHLNRLYGIELDRQVIIPNGVNLDRFAGMDEVVKQPRRFVYSSSPDRGVDVVLTMWQEIRHMWPDAELNVFYGWTAIDKILSHGQSEYLAMFKDNVMDSINRMGGEKAGIIWHDRVDQYRLAQEFAISDVWLYPTYFLETYCITAIEMQAAQVIPVVNPIGALKETVPFPDLWAPGGYPNNETFQKGYLAKLKEIVEADDETKTLWRQRGRRFAMDKTWDAAYAKWVQLINDRLGGELWSSSTTSSLVLPS